MGRIIDETGNRYGRLTVVRRNPENAYHKGANWICRCECGGERVASGIGLRQGLIKSCGCLIRETRVLRCACGYKGQKTRDWTPDWKCYRCSGASPLQEPPKMTDDEIFEKRAEHWRYYHRSAPTSASHDVMLFLERLEKTTRERDEARAEVEHAYREGGALYEAKIALAEAEAERDEARANYQWMVDRACDEKLEGYRELAAKRAQLEEERDKARAEAALSLAMARIADEKHGWKCAEVDMLRGVGCMEDGDGPCGVCRKCFYRHGYRRGAEAMREACQQWCRAWENNGEAIADALADLRVEDKP